MKKTHSAIILVLSLLLSALLIGGCAPAISTETSDIFEKSQSSLLGEAEEIRGTIDPAPERSENREEPVSEDGSEVASSIPPVTEGRLLDEESATYRYIPPASPTTLYTAACAKTALNVRKGPSTNYAPLFLLRAGDSLPYLWREGEWLAVWTGSRVGYLHGGYAYLAATSQTIEAVIRAGLDKLGTPYEWGAPRILTDKGTVNPYFTGNSFDCSSFVQYCYYVGAGIRLGDYTGSQAAQTVGERITSYDALRRGDFYFTGSGTISHVVIYLGGGYLLQTYSANGGPVSVTTEERWRGKFISGRRPNSIDDWES